MFGEFNTPLSVTDETCRQKNQQRYRRLANYQSILPNGHL